MLQTKFSQHFPEAGCDEAGRGCLAGPVVAAAVILPENFENEILNDSKKLSHEQRMSMREVIKSNALAWCVGSAGADEVDKINILNATFLAMHRAISGLKIRPEFLLIDGNRFKKYSDKKGKIIPHQCIVKGDGKYMSIAAASILAKTERDELMENYHQQFPQFGWNKNKGYGTAFHRKAIFQFGTSPLHRKTFHLSGKQTKLEL